MSYIPLKKKFQHIGYIGAFYTYDLFIVTAAMLKDRWDHPV